VNPATPASVLRFWFGDADGLAKRRCWFAKDAAFDRQIEARFGTLVERALAGVLGHWGQTAPARLARILLLDQFTRNIYRGSARAFAGDPLALAEARTLIDRDGWPTLPPNRRVFACMPLVHAEDPALQTRCVALLERLAGDYPALEDYLDHARRHREVILRFGRFPHRNALLGRASSGAEQAFLARPGSRF